MPLVTTKTLFDWAEKRGRAVCAFNINNMELVQAVAAAAGEMKLPVILQVSKGARSYANPVFLRKLAEAVCETTDVPIALHLDHGDSFEICRDCIDSGFSSVMFDGSALGFEENIAITKRVVDYAKPRGVSVEGELGELAGVEDDVRGGEVSHYTNPAQAREFVERTGVTALAVSIGTSHGAHKFRPGTTPSLRLDILAEIHAQIPATPLVLHGASSVTPADVATINACGGRIDDALGTPENQLAATIPLGVRKINIDSDLRLAFTAAIRRHLAENPGDFDPRQYLRPARERVTDIVRRKLEVFTK